MPWAVEMIPGVVLTEQRSAGYPLLYWESFSNTEVEKILWAFGAAVT